MIIEEIKFCLSISDCLFLIKVNLNEDRDRQSIIEIIN